MSKIKIEISFFYNSEQYNDIVFIDYLSNSEIKRKIVELHTGIVFNEISNLNYKRID
jgi:hypothetical protein